MSRIMILLTGIGLMLAMAAFITLVIILIIREIKVVRALNNTEKYMKEKYNNGKING